MGGREGAKAKGSAFGTKGPALVWGWILPAARALTNGGIPGVLAVSPRVPLRAKMPLELVYLTPEATIQRSPFVARMEPRAA